MHWSSCPSNLFGVAAGSTIVRMLQSFSYLRFRAPSILNHRWQLRRLKVEVVFFLVSVEIALSFQMLMRKNIAFLAMHGLLLISLRIVMIVREHGAKFSTFSMFSPFTCTQLSSVALFVIIFMTFVLEVFRCSPTCVLASLTLLTSD